MRKTTMFAAGAMLMPLAALGLAREELPDPADDASEQAREQAQTQDREDRDVQFESDALPDAAPVGCCYIMINGMVICIPGC